MGFCSSCGFQLQEGMKFCPNCGHKIEEFLVSQETNKEVVAVSIPTDIDGIVDSLYQYNLVLSANKMSWEFVVQELGLNRTSDLITMEYSICEDFRDLLVRGLSLCSENDDEVNRKRIIDKAISMSFDLITSARTMLSDFGLMPQYYPENILELYNVSEAKRIKAKSGEAFYRALCLCQIDCCDAIFQDVMNDPILRAKEYESIIKEICVTFNSAWSKYLWRSKRYDDRAGSDFVRQYWDKFTHFASAVPMDVVGSIPMAVWDLDFSDVDIEHRETNFIKNFASERKSFFEKKRENEAIQKQEELESYWSQHLSERKELEKHLNALRSRLQDIDGDIEIVKKKIADLVKQKNSKVEAEDQYQRISGKRNRLNSRLNNLNIFQKMEKSRLTKEIAELNQLLMQISADVQKQKAAKNSTIQTQLDELNQQMNALSSEKNRSDAEFKRIVQKLNNPVNN